MERRHLAECGSTNTEALRHLRDGGAFDVARYGWIADYADAQNFLFLLESGNAGLNVGKRTLVIDGEAAGAETLLEPGI